MRRWSGRQRGRALLAVVLALAVVAVLGWAGNLVWERATRTDLERALAVVPSQSKRVTFTDWRDVRAAVGADLGDTPDREAVQQMVDAAYDRDLAAASGVDEAAGAMQELFGFGPGTARWEAYAQSEEGAALVLKLPEGTDLDVLGDNLASAGYTRPDDPDGVWEGGVDLVADLDPSLTPVVQYVALLPGPDLVVASDTAPYAEEAAEVAEGSGDAVLGDDGVDRLADRLEGSVAAVLWTGDFACADLAMATADQAAQEEASARVRELGGLSPLAGLGMGLQPSGTLRVVAHLEDADRAERDLRPRAELAAGTAYGRGGEFGDDFEVARARTVGPDVVLDLRPLREGAFLLSGLYDGPVVFAGC